MSDEDEDDSLDIDPFESLSRNREGDPFESLDGPEEDDDDRAEDDSTDGFWFDALEEDFQGRSGEEDGPASGQDPAGGIGPGESASGTETGSIPDPTVDDPFGGFESREGDPFDESESAFERIDVGDVDPDDVWDAIASEGDAGGERPQPSGSRYDEVSKHAFCEQCEHFSRPPEVACTHEDGKIVEFLDMETVRLLNCPVVAERRELERET